MKKLLTLLTVLVLFVVCAALLPTQAQAAEVASGTCGDNLTWVLDDIGTLTISGTGAMAYDNTSDSIPWDDYRRQIQNVIIKDGVTNIAFSAFSWCSNLTSVTIPNSVTSIGDYAFTDCSSLTSITIPDSVASIGTSVFSGCNNLKYNVYDNANYLGNTKNPYIILICATASDITQCHIADSTKSIQDEAFIDCSSLTSITIPDSVTSIGGGAFIDCSSLTSVTIGIKVTHIGNSAFYGCSSLTSITIPDSVISIGYGAFIDCSSLTSVTIGRSVTYIGDSAFYTCTSLKDIYIASLAAWCNIDFVNHTSNPLYYANNLYLNGELITTLVIPDGTSRIRSYAFWNYSNLTSATIPDSITSIGREAFSGCNNLWHVLYKGNEQYWNAIDINKTGNHPLLTATIHYNCTGNEITDPVNKVCTLCAPACTHAYDNTCDTACNLCGAARTISHSWDSGKVTKAATCKEAGVKTYTCSVCKTTKTESIAKLTTHTPAHRLPQQRTRPVPSAARYWPRQPEKPHLPPRPPRRLLLKLPLKLLLKRPR